MLQELQIQNFALIDELQIQLHAGLNILTGETGAGKSIIIDALDMLLGGRASSDFIRTGHKKAQILAIFQINENQKVQALLDELGIENDSHQLLLSREITETGNNRLRMNGQMATRNMVAEIAHYLLDIHGQNEHQTLMNKREHLQLLDEFGGKELQTLKAEVAERYSNLNKIRKELATLRQNEQEKYQRIDLLKFQMEDIDQATLAADEEDHLQSRRKILMNAEKLFKNASQVNSLFTGDGYEAIGVMDLMGKLLKNLEDMEQIDQNLSSVKEMVESAYFQLQEASYEVGGYTDGIEFDQEELMKIEDRLSVLSQLKRKYGQSIEEILEYREKIGTELDSLTHSEERIEELEVEQVKVMEEFVKVAQELSEKRKEVGTEFAWKVMREMTDLSMPNAKFYVETEWQEGKDGVEIDGTSYQYSVDGLDQVEFLISPNPGEDLKPLIKIASGGETSRIMLAIKSVTFGLEEVDSVIFDEVDSGVGGEAGQRVAEKLALIAKDRQVICITHLPQIAAMADQHYHIYKEIKDERTRSNIVCLDEKRRTEELARMVSGSVNDVALDHASTMLMMARKKKEEL